jgi:hypothetical protein
MLQIYLDFLKGSRSHKRFSEEKCFFVSSKELADNFYGSYKKPLQNILIAYDETYVLPNKGGDGLTKAYCFSAEAIRAFEELLDNGAAGSLRVKWRKNTDACQKMEEYYNLSAIKSLLDKDIKIEHKRALKMLLLVSDKDGGNLVQYRRPRAEDKGRRFAITPSMQNIPNEYRKLILKNNTTDVDFVNAHPNIISGFAKAMKMPAFAINTYCLNRAQKLAELAKELCVSEKDIKKLFLMLVYGARLSFNKRKPFLGRFNAVTEWAIETGADKSFKYNREGSVIWPQFIKDFAQEMKNISLAILKRSDAAWLPENERTVQVARGVSMFIQDVEDNMLQTLERSLEEKGIQVTSLLFDGLHIKGVGHDLAGVEVNIQNMLKTKWNIDMKVELKLSEMIVEVK